MLGALTPICYPFWNGDISALRYVLQSTVARRYDCHAPPPFPFPRLSPAERVSLEQRHRDDSNTTAAVVESIYQREEPLSRRPELGRLLMYIRRTGPPNYDFHPQVNSEFPHNEVLLYLDSKDVASVITILDKYYTPQYTLTCEGFSRGYVDSIHATLKSHDHSNSTQLCPANLMELIYMKKSWQLTMRRTYAVARRYHDNGE